MRPAIAALAFAVSGLFASAGARADTQYVIELLYVVVNSQADGSGERVGQIKSGDKVEVLEKQGDQARVQLANGEEGWVKASYLSADPPLREQLSARKDEIDKLHKEKSQLEADLAAAKSAAASAQANANAAIKAASTAANSSNKSLSAGPTPAPAPVAAETSAVSTVAAAPEPSPQSAPPLFEDTSVMPSRPSWLLALASAGIALLIGFVLGWRMLDRRIRAKYGGLRIY